jgi:hypothetical protein
LIVQVFGDIITCRPVIVTDVSEDRVVSIFRVLHDANVPGPLSTPLGEPQISQILIAYNRDRTPLCGRRKEES